MSTRRRTGLVALLASIVLLANLAAGEKPKPEAKKESAAAAATAAVKPKPLADQVKKGLAYLVNQQHPNGGWGQGGGWRTAKQGSGRVEGKEVQDPPDVGNTCMALLALIRAGNTPKEGEYAKNVAKGLEFIAKHVEEADKPSMYITPIRDTQLQSKIGPYVDTFAAALVLAELKGRMGDEKGEKRLLAALDKVMDKIERNQKANGTFAGNQGWASVLSQGLCSKALNRAAQNGVKVSEQVLERDYRQAAAGLDKQTGKFAAAEKVPGGASDAGIPLYQNAGKGGGLQERVNTLKDMEAKNAGIVASPTAPRAEKETAQRELTRIKGDLRKAEGDNDAALKGVVAQVDDKRFIAGFGNNGGEEFLSYMNIGETLVVKGGPEWTKWDKSITQNLSQVQNQDGSWSGHHCITGRTFCTSSALLVLMADRAPIPTAAKLKK